MATHRDPRVSQQGVTGLQSLQRLAAATKAGIYGAPAPVIPNAGPTPGAMGSGTFGMDQNVPMFNQRNVPPLNLTTPAVNQLTPPAAAPVNLLAAAPQADAAKTLQAEFTRLSQFTDLPGVKERMDLIKEQLKELSTPRVVGRNLVIGGKTIFTAPQDVTLSPLARLQTEMNALPPGDPRIPQYVAAINKETTRAAPPVVNISNVTEKAEAADFGKLLVKGYDAVNESASLARKSLPAIESNLAILNKGFSTGFGTETVTAGAKVLGALGVKDAEKFASNAQVFLANANNAVLQKQLEQKGVQTAADADRITSTGAQFGNTKDANEFILKVAKEQLQRDIEQRVFYAAWRDKIQTFNGAENAWFTGPGGKSLFERPGLKAYAAGPNVKEVAPDRTKGLDKIFKPR
jgi:hypothetical protein